MTHAVNETYHPLFRLECDVENGWSKERETTAWFYRLKALHLITTANGQAYPVTYLMGAVCPDSHMHTHSSQYEAYTITHENGAAIIIRGYGIYLFDKALNNTHFFDFNEPLERYLKTQNPEWWEALDPTGQNTEHHTVNQKVIS
jgi:hypothetical protein